jgi:hypothetical protein
LCLLKKLKQQSRDTLDERRPALIQALKDIGDFYVEFKWDFQSWGMKSLYKSFLKRLQTFWTVISLVVNVAS